MAVPSDNDQGIAPFLSQVHNEILKKVGNIALFASPFRLEDGYNKLAIEARVYVERYITVLMIIMVEQA